MKSRYIPGLVYEDRTGGRWSPNAYGTFLVFLSGPAPIQYPPAWVEEHCGPLELEDYQCKTTNPATGRRCSMWYGHPGAHATAAALDEFDPVPNDAPWNEIRTMDLVGLAAAIPTTGGETIPTTAPDPFRPLVTIPRPRPAEIAIAMSVHCLCMNPYEHHTSCPRFPARYHASPPEGSSYCWDIDPRAYRCHLLPGHEGEHVHVDPVAVDYTRAELVDAGVIQAPAAAAELEPAPAARSRWESPRPIVEDTDPASPAEPNPKAGYALGINQCAAESDHPDDSGRLSPRLVRCVGVKGHIGRHAALYAGHPGDPDAGVMYW